MATEVLAIKEETLGEFIDLLRVGLGVRSVSPALKERLIEWCREEEEYLRESFHEEFWPTVKEGQS